jgi:hypothetical protein
VPQISSTSESNRTISASSSRDAGPATPTRNNSTPNIGPSNTCKSASKTILKPDSNSLDSCEGHSACFGLIREGQILSPLRVLIIVTRMRRKRAKDVYMYIPWDFAKIRGPEAK